MGALQKQLAESEQDQADASGALRASERAISDINRELADLARRNGDAENELRVLGSAAAQLEAAIDEQQIAFGKLLAQRYRQGHAPLLRLLLSGEDPNRVARQLHYYGYIARAQAGLLEELRSNLERQQDLESKAAQARADLAKIERSRVTHKQQLEKEHLTRLQALALISKEVDAQRREIGDLQRDEARLAELLERIEKIIASRPKAPPPRRDQERGQRPPRHEIDAFGQFKGKLNLPVQGELAHRFGSPRPGGGTVWKGLFIQADSGQGVQAIAPGRVVFADWLRGFGNLMIVDHGENYMSLYGNNETLYKQVGEAVARGERLAAVGNSGGNTSSGLYFEMRHRGKPFDPMGWLNSK